jgi:hypothetical protein
VAEDVTKRRDRRCKLTNDNDSKLACYCRRHLQVYSIALTCFSCRAAGHMRGPAERTHNCSGSACCGAWHARTSFGGATQLRSSEVCVWDTPNVTLDKAACVGICRSEASGLLCLLGTI